MTDDRIGEIWRLPENYCKPLAFGRAIEAECRGVPDYVWMIGTKGFMALFATEEAANDWQQMNGTNTPASYIQPVRIPVIAAAPKPDRLKSEPVAGPDFCDRPTRPALEAVFRDRPEYFEPDCECGAVASEHCPACEPVAQEPVAFYIYKETAPRLGIQNVVADSLPWVYDQDPSSGFSARLKVYLAPPDQSAEVERLKADWLKLYEEFAKANNANYARIAELERQRDVLAKLLCRYRNETPPGHQPHMIAHEVDAALASVKGNAEVTGVTTGENDAT